MDTVFEDKLKSIQGYPDKRMNEWMIEAWRLLERINCFGSYFFPFGWKSQNIGKKKRKEIQSSGRAWMYVDV